MQQAPQSQNAQNYALQPAKQPQPERKRERRVIDTSAVTVNADRYAETRAHGLLMARKSRRAAAQNLRQKGLNSQQIEQALETVYAPDENGERPELEAAAALVASRYRKQLADARRDLVVAA